ncbi:MAG TPA: M3 family metallopeptidase [Candidatus Limnocylindria bacterium]|nr:M3 family metallopeptidase [Candidatus Limnocylindria bacterium]
MTTTFSPSQTLVDDNRARLGRARDHLRRIEALPKGSRDVLEALNDLALEVSTLGAECGLLSEVHPEKATREAAEELVREATKFNTELMQHRGLYEALGALDAAGLGAIEKRVVDLTRRDMRRAGIELDEKGRERVKALRQELVEITQEFSRNIRDDVRSIEIPPGELAGMPDDYVKAHPAGSDGNVRITTDYPDSIPFMSYARSDAARRALMRASSTRATPRNLEVLDTMLAKRHELANLLGYATWADYALEILMMEKPDNTRAFIERAYDATREAGAAERARLLAMKRRMGLPEPDTLNEHEMTFLTERVKAEELSFDARTVRPYFEYRRVRQAILDLSSELFDMTFTKIDLPLWDPSVETFDVTVAGKPAGRISLDMFPREGKFKHAACFGYRPGLGGKQLPHYVLVCNFPDPDAPSGPALMEHREVVTYFHEFGHLVHSIVRGEVPWMRVSQVTEWDFVEAPSQFLEEWIYDYGVLRRFAKHVETGEPISSELVEQLRTARDFGRGLFVQRQLFFSALSLAYHDRDPRTLDTTKTLFELAERYSPSKVDPASRFQASFGHLEGYTAAYATYMWSLVIAKDLHTRFTKGLMDIEEARRYRDLVLRPGGSKPAAELVKDFLGRPFGFDAFRRWLAPEAAEKKGTG